ncbi:MAG: hypothetical protein M1826_005388 [Phylliscum demangeonii]|nr:MAG: hypothetical protein M1826_005388 [Phylliscum demangeonii]
MEYLRTFTNIPIPKVVRHSPSSKNELGFEWILMEFVHGTTLGERWMELPMTTKERLVRQLASFQAQLFAQQRHQIGNVYRALSSPTPSEYSVGRIVSHEFFWADHIHQTVPRGPFQNSHDWLSSRLALLRLDQQRVLESGNLDDSSDPEDEREYAVFCLSVVQKLLELLPRIFPPDTAESTCLFHDDLSMYNILVDEHGVLTAVLDWECVPMLPLWRACTIPDLLHGPERHEKPSIETFSYDGTIDQLYWEELLEFEATQLRTTFLDEMRRLCPEWVQAMERTELQRDFDKAVAYIDELWVKEIKKWLDDFEDEETRWSLGTRIH